MAVRKVYTNKDLELEVTWSEEGIHLNINHIIPNELPGIEYILEPSDLPDFLEDIDIFTEAVNDTKSEK